MSFSADVKAELIRCQPTAPCCAAAQAYGMLEGGQAFSADAIAFQTENAALLAGYEALVSAVCGLRTDDWQRLRRASGLDRVAVADAAARRRVLERFGHAAGEISLRLNRANLDCDACAGAYLRGLFLVCGAVSDPRAAYHLEFHIPYYHLSRDVLALLRELELPARAVRRKGSNVVYLKESGHIEDCLTRLGATQASLEVMNVKVVKDIRNTANRVANCENANIDKTVTAALAQIEAIRRLEARGGLDSLPDELRALARLRVDNPDLSLRELGVLLTPPLSRSGVNHRLRRLIELAGPATPRQ